LPPEEAILFHQIGGHLPLPAIQPAGQRRKQQVEDRDVDHEQQLISRKFAKIAAIGLILNWDITASTHRRIFPAREIACALASFGALSDIVSEMTAR
jgi:hypothetical protein